MVFKRFNLSFKIYSLFVPAIFFSCHLFAIIDLDQTIQKFILDTQKIEIPGCPDAFNPTIIRWKDKYLMCFRIRDPLTALTHQIGCIWLDDFFKPIGPPTLLSIEFKFLFFPPRTQDPRLISMGEELYILFNDMINFGNSQMRRMYIGKMQCDGTCFFVEEPEVLLHFNGERSDKHEKNWAPFVYGNQLLLSQSINPHHVLRSISESNACETIALTHSSLISWEWGELRGGTPALKDGDEYLAFFHSSKDMKTIQSNGQKITHYFMGAYTFKGEPPFNLTKISPEPIVANTFYKEPYYKTWKPIRVVFPSGFIYDDKYIWISYGRQDYEVCIIKLDKEGLYKSLIPVGGHVK